MSVSLFIHWKDGRKEEVLLWPQEHARAWGQMGQELGLQYFDGAFPILVDSENVGAVVDEARSLIRANETRQLSLENRLLSVMQYLDRLRKETDWEAMIS